MKKKTVITTLCLLGFAAAAGNFYENPALNQVQFQPAAEQQEVPLIVNGKPVCVIVRDMQAEKQKMDPGRRSIGAAVDTLRDAFQRLTGEKPPVLDANSPEIKKYQSFIAVGKSALTEKLNIDPFKECREFSGFLVRTVPGGIVIAGYDGSLLPNHYNRLDWGRLRHNGTAYGAYDFCERVLGLRYYYPGIGIYSKPCRELSVRPVSYKDHAEFRERYSYSYARIENYWPWPDIKKDARRFDNAWRMARETPWVHGHSPNPLAVQKVYPGKQETLFFRNQDGYLYYNHMVTNGNVWDVTNPELAKIFAEMFKKFYDTNGKWRLPWKSCTPPSSEYVIFCPTDTYVRNFSNERSKKFIYPDRLEVRHGSASDVYANFYCMLGRELKKVLPTKKLAVYFYHSYTDPPKGEFDFPDNVRGTVCNGNPIYVRNPKARKLWQDRINGWSKALKHPVGVYFYGDLSNAFTQAIQGYYAGEFLRALGPSLWRDATYLDAGHNWRFYYSYYLVYRSLWNPNFNAKAALDEHWDLLYGKKAGAILKEFYQLILDRWENRIIPKLAAHKGNENVTPEVLYAAMDGRTIEKMEALLKAAYNATAPGSIERRRMDFIMPRWKKEFTVARNYHLNTIPEDRTRQIAGTEVKVDGKLDEEVWKKASVMQFKDATGYNAQLKAKPEARMLWGKEGFWIACRAQGKSNAQKGSIFSHSDNFECFLSPGSKKMDYVQLVVSAAGDIMLNHRTVLPIPGYLTPIRKPAGLLWAVSRTDSEWSFELFVPHKTFDAPVPRAYSSMFGNFIYNTSYKSGSVMGSWSVTMRNNHDTKYFGRMKLLGKGD